MCDCAVLREEDLQTKCRDANITPFASTSAWMENAIYLDSLDDLFQLCKMNAIHYIFYLYTFPEIEDYEIDITGMTNLLKKDFDRSVSFYKFKYISSDYFADIFTDIIEEMTEDAQCQNEGIKKVDGSRPDSLEVFACLSGCEVGVLLAEAWDQTEEGEILFLDRKAFYKKYSHALHSKLEERLSQAKEEEERIQQQKASDYEEALKDMERFLKEDTRLLDCRYKTDRQTYAEQLRAEWSDKIGQPLLQKDIKNLVERIYTQRFFPRDEF
ncbi:MAG TPA: hypothetical protein H9694_10095 [Firmicutes bacterium]|nr:hypothetical protein [Bacillota bacterium]